mmetsp:Transcript_12344/g.30952  ORF Transcript_12344/g.30952 Transcript_12344/m.30952 type:complete len:233 (+) Transcript_12344:15-713(+)
MSVSLVFLIVELKHHDVALVHDVLLALETHHALVFRSAPTAFHIQKVRVAYRLSLDETLLKIRVNHTSGLGSGHALTNRPRAALRLARREVRAKTKKAVCLPNETLQATLTHAQTVEELEALVVAQVDELALHLRAHHHHGCILRLRRHPEGLHVHVRIRIGELILAHIRGVDERLGSEQLQARKELQLLVVEAARANRLTRLELRHKRLDELFLRLKVSLFVSLRLLDELR